MSCLGEEYLAAVSAFRTSVKVWLRLFCTCLSTGWVFLFETLYYISFLTVRFTIIIGLALSVPRVSGYEDKIPLLIHHIGGILHSITIIRIRLQQRRLSTFFENVLESSKRTVLGNVCLTRTMRNFRKFCTFSASILFLILSIFIFVPFIKAFNERDFNRVSIMSIPYFLTCTHSGFTVTNNTDFLCWDVNNYSQYMIKNLYLCIPMCITFFCLFGFMIFIAFLTLYVKVNVRIIREELEVLTRMCIIPRQRVNMRQDFQRLRNIKIRRKLSNLIAYYLRVHR